MNLLASFRKHTVCTGGTFGHNIDFDFYPHFEKIQNFGVEFIIED